LYLEVSKAEYSRFLLATDVVVPALKKKFLQALIDFSRTVAFYFGGSSGARVPRRL
jgi:hypothetical protein